MAVSLATLACVVAVVITHGTYLVYWVLAAIGVGGGIVLTLLARRHPGRWAHRAATALGCVLLAKGGLWTYTMLRMGPWTLANGLPLYLCDFTAFLAGVGCIVRWRPLVELTWFWGLAGCIFGLLTPELEANAWHLLFVQYLVGHVAIVVAACYLVLGLSITPGPHAVRRAYLVTLGYTAVCGVIDVVSGGNYMLLAHKPRSWSPLNLFGPWPWYLVVAGLVGLGLFLLLDRLARAAARPPLTPAVSQPEFGGSC